jgi:hypothetical protein
MTERLSKEESIPRLIFRLVEDMRKQPVPTDEASKRFNEAIIRHAKGVIAAHEEYLKAQK